MSTLGWHLSRPPLNESPSQTCSICTPCWPPVAKLESPVLKLCNPGGAEWACSQIWWVGAQEASRKWTSVRSGGKSEKWNTVDKAEMHYCKDSEPHIPLLFEHQLAFYARRCVRRGLHRRGTKHVPGSSVRRHRKATCNTFCANTAFITIERERAQFLTVKSFLTLSSVHFKVEITNTTARK